MGMTIVSLLIALWLFSAIGEVTCGLARILWGILLLASAALLWLLGLLNTLCRLAMGRMPR